MPLVSRVLNDFNNPIDVKNEMSNLDYRYGIYTDVAEALTYLVYYIDPIDGLQTLRGKGRTVGIETNGSVEEYWFRDGILDEHLIRKHITHFGEFNNEMNVPITNLIQGDRMVITEDTGIYTIGAYFYSEDLQTWVKEPDLVGEGGGTQPDIGLPRITNTL